MLFALATEHEVAFTSALVLPVALTFLLTYSIARRRLSRAPHELVGRLALTAGVFSTFLAIGDLSVIPGQIRHLSFDVMCLAVPLLMVVLGASWGVFGASAVLAGRNRRQLRGILN